MSLRPSKRPAPPWIPATGTHDGHSGGSWATRLRQAWRGRFGTSVAEPLPRNAEPIWAELFSIERLEQHAASLAVAQHVRVKSTADHRLDDRLREGDESLRASYHAMVAALREHGPITPAADWLVDNFHVVEEQIRAIRTDLPPGFYRELPKLRDGPFAGYPRVIGLAWAFVAHTDSHINPEMLRRFVRAYQTVQPLTIGELWAVGISLRVVLVENLRRLGEDIVNYQEGRQEANILADRLLGAGREAESAEAILGPSHLPLRTAFVVQFVQRLREQDPRVIPAMHWLDECLAAQGTNTDAMVHAEQQRQGAVNVTIRNVITSMRLMSALDWRQMFENISLVDEALRADSDFAALDFATRDQYRRVIEELARGSQYSEIEIVRRVIEQAGTTDPALLLPQDEAEIARRRDPGYYLIAQGRPAFEKSIGFRPSFKGWLVRAHRRAGISLYIGVIAVMTMLAVWGMLGVELDRDAYWVLWVMAALAVIPASDAAMALVNGGAVMRVHAISLPGLALAAGVPDRLRTMVVMPTLLTTQAVIAEQIERLEVHYLANDDGELRFALLTDWTDADAEHMAGDEELLAFTAGLIAALNQRHGPASGGDRFFLYHRRRQWNGSQQSWIGWERKRGKLHEFNRLLRGAADTSFIAVDGHAPVAPAAVRYVIVLDADTRLPRGAAKRLVGKMAHPLNRPSLDPASGRVVRGYAILQPRVTPSMPRGRDGSLFQRIFSSTRGIDPYASAVSDIYQDLFGEGSYCGKGIYEVDAFEAALDGRIPDNTLLSHDLLEGVFARAGLVSDIEVIDDFPARYDMSVARQHRWARGDWQLLPWILGNGPHGAKRKDKIGAFAAIPLIGRWKMTDNLRRSLSAPACFLALLGGWLLPIHSPALWSAFVVATMATPSLMPFLTGLMPRRGARLRTHLRVLARHLRLAVAQVVLLVVFLPFQAWLMVDAILRTLTRLLITRRNLLQWVSAAQYQSNPQLGWFGFFRQMWGGMALALVASALMVRFAPASWTIAAPFVAWWVLSPAVARWISQPAPGTLVPTLGDDDAQALRLIARRTWRFFETFVTAEEHMLPPDNFQEEPVPVVAHRTSPTNVGLYLLSVLAARDFGWIGTTEAIERLEATMLSMSALERFRGHFYNWYDTSDLRPLDPKYISTVDSGNLAGHLVALRQGCIEMVRHPVSGPQWSRGPLDALNLLRESLQNTPNSLRSAVRNNLDDAVLHLAALLAEVPNAPVAMAGRLKDLVQQAEHVAGLTHALAHALAHGPSGNTDTLCADAICWAEAIGASIRSHQRDLDGVMPWAGLLDPGAGLALAMGAVPSLADLPGFCGTAISILNQRPDESDAAPHSAPHPASKTMVEGFIRSIAAASALETRIMALAETAAEFFAAMKFDFLFDPERELLAIGYRVADNTLDPSYYDLLASEARLASFVAIAKGDVPTRHWFRLGRTLVEAGDAPALISWSGSMFEYLMPSLVMRAPIGSLLEQTTRQIVREQIQYGADRKVPWGTSESAYNARDLEFTYQYKSFGIPELALKRGLGDSTVIAPYATALAAMVEPQQAVRNYARITAIGGRGRHGWYEALDFTKIRLPEGKEFAIIRAYMAHHQGMTVVAIANTLDDGAMRSRFHAEPIIQATELLLQESMPYDVEFTEPKTEVVAESVTVAEITSLTQRRFNSPFSVPPRTHLLSNGRYSVMITAAGSGYSRWRGMAITRWREDATRDPWGAYIFLRDIRSGDLWSAGFQPCGAKPDRYDVVYSEGRAEIVRTDGTITTTMEVVVSSEDDAEVRRISINNRGLQARYIEITSYAEIVLAPPDADDAHPAFSKMFVETEYVADVSVLLATRRSRLPADAQMEDPPIWAAHLAVIEGETIGEGQFETDRARFLGRGGDVAAPLAVTQHAPLSSSVGTVLDPVFSLRYRLRIPARSTARIAFWTLVAPSRLQVLDLADKHRDAVAFDRATTLAWTQAQVELRHLGIGAGEAHLFQNLANRVIYADASSRPGSETIKRGAGAASQLWVHGISGDLPIVLLRIEQSNDLAIVRQLLLAHEYWRTKQLSVDLVILSEEPPSYVQDFQNSLNDMVRMIPRRLKPAGEAAPGAIFLLRADLVSPEFRNQLASVARVVLVGHRGSLAEQLRRAPELRPFAGLPKRAAAAIPPFVAPALPALEFFNGLGGFGDQGKEYVTILSPGKSTPAPWVNVISNPSFGFLSSVDGSGTTWSLDSQQNHITPWSNDAVADAPGEVIYVRDDETGELWGPTALPIRLEGATYVAHHGQGYSRFEHRSHGITLELLQYVPVDDSIKISRLKLTDHSGESRRLSVTAYVEWVLGTTRARGAPFVVTEIDAQTGALLARNPWNNDFGGRVAFADMAGRQQSITCDRTEFIGRNGALNRPLALEGELPLSGRLGAGFDPCGALQTKLELAANGSAELVFLLGETANLSEAQALIAKYRAIDLDEVLRAVSVMWDATLGAVQVTTPDRSMDILLNRWLLYQTLACRIWARSGFYQASGAYGFRDQLQDGMALCIARPDLTREHLLRAAGRQFREGDVQHWWLPMSGRGIRTRMSDDRIWLSYVTAHYLRITGDLAVLAEQMPFLEGPALREGEMESFFQPGVADECADLFEHCARGLDHSLTVGAHGLPLIGGGDWNDGLNRVGVQGKGESIWLGWFLHAALIGFAPVAEGRGEHDRAQTWREHAINLAEALERDGWDGDWYRRAYYDDGTPLGAAMNAECRIDSIAQSWSVISRAADPVHAAKAMAKVATELVAHEDEAGGGLLLLFTPPFDQTKRDPGYIKAYPPGLRENGGQYTHAAIWSVIAWAMQGDGDQAGEIYGMLNPINHARTKDEVARYKVEPYAVCADIYSVAPHFGRGGWSWYTGAAAWMYRAGLETILGFRLEGGVLCIDPCIPRQWPGFGIVFRYKTARYDITVENPHQVCRGIVRTELDGVPLAGGHTRIALVDDAATHTLLVVLG